MPRHAFSPWHRSKSHHCMNGSESQSKKQKMSVAATRRAIGKLSPSNTALLVCDVQERFRSVIDKMETVVHTTKFMTSVAKELNVPIVVSQQYTKVFGPTVADAFADPSNPGSSVPAGVRLFEKKKFSMLTDECSQHLASLDRSSFLLVGIEAHVCLQQTVFDLLEQGHDCWVVADAVSSQRPYDRDTALRLMESCGARVTTAQSAGECL